MIITLLIYQYLWAGDNRSGTINVALLEAVV